MMLSQLSPAWLESFGTFTNAKQLLFTSQGTPTAATFVFFQGSEVVPLVLGNSWKLCIFLSYLLVWYNIQFQERGLEEGKMVEKKLVEPLVMVEKWEKRRLRRLWQK